MSPPAAAPPSQAGRSGRARSIRRALVAGALVLAGSAAAVVGLPFWMVRHAGLRAERCAEAAQAGAELHPIRCIERARAWLFYPSLLPWTRERAQAVGPLDPAAAARLALDVSTAVRPHAARRDAAAAALVTADAETTPDLRDQALEAGALDGIFPYGSAGLDRSEVYGGLWTAFMRGEWGAAERFALALDSAPPRDPRNAEILRNYRCALPTYALLGVLGRERDAQAAFAGAACCDGFRCYPDRTRVQWLGYVAAGGDLAAPRHPPDPSDAVEARLVLAVTAADPGARRVDAQGSWRKDSGSTRMISAALVAIQVQEKPTRIAEILGWFEASMERPGASFPWTLPDDLLMPLQRPAFGCYSRDPFTHDRACFVPAALYEEAASRLDALAAALPAPPAPLAPPAPPPGAHPPGPAARTPEPGPDDLRWLAWKLRVFAATEWIHRGQPARARGLIAPPPPAGSSRLGPELAMLPARLALAAGDPRGALEALAAVRAREKLLPLHESLLSTYESLAHVALGEWERALEQARRADERIWSLPTRDLCRAPSRHECTPEDQPKGFVSMRVRVRLLRAALAWRLGRVEEALAPVPTTLPGDTHPIAGAEDLRRVLDVLRLPPGARGPARLAVAPVRHADWMTTAELYLVGEAARGDGDIEVWLDRVFSPMMREGDRTTMRARAEAARLRGDAEAAARWEARAHAIEQRIVDDRTAILAHIAGL